MIHNIAIAIHLLYKNNKMHCEMKNEASKSQSDEILYIVSYIASYNAYECMHIAILLNLLAMMELP